MIINKDVILYGLIAAIVFCRQAEVQIQGNQFRVQGMTLMRYILQYIIMLCK